MYEHHGMYTAGAWRPAATDESTDVVNPADERVIATVPAGTGHDVDAAVAAARTALPGWARTAPAERAAALTALGRELRARVKEFAETITAELGSPLALSRLAHVRTPLAVLDSYAELAAQHPFEERIGRSTVLLEPVGVVGAITPWNYPLHQMVSKVAPALAAGCTIVVKPAEETPLTARLLAECVAAAGLPPGVFNLVTGVGEVAGRALAEHPDVGMVSFTGSTAVGKEVAAHAARTIRRVALELGGKSPNVILPSADHTTAVRTGVTNVFTNSGQTCSAWTRMLVHRSRYEEAVALAVDAAAAYAPGDPLDPATRMGPLVSARQRARVRDCVRRGIKEGARLVTGGPEAPEGLPRGYFVRPTIFADVTPDMYVAQEEIFGPVLSIMKYEDEDDAVRMANHSVYGLSGAVWSAETPEAVAFARRLNTGQVDINGARFNPLAPFGGWKQSGIGRELGRHGLMEYLQTKSLQL
ncbi:aldehyde dehydrogenase family protein [Streptomyces sp. NPDC006335]|uniref:aldehyde dehydrogenase family protein n=1 Tax=Streptomyces sp. NPDC006335 TaxID=3156895 RepID=UPI0033B0907A